MHTNTVSHARWRFVTVCVCAIFPDFFLARIHHVVVGTVHAAFCCFIEVFSFFHCCSLNFAISFSSTLHASFETSSSAVVLSTKLVKKFFLLAPGEMKISFSTRSESAARCYQWIDFIIIDYRSHETECFWPLCWFIFATSPTSICAICLYLEGISACVGSRHGISCWLCARGKRVQRSLYWNLLRLRETHTNSGITTHGRMMRKRGWNSPRNIPTLFGDWSPSTTNSSSFLITQT